MTAASGPVRLGRTVPAPGCRTRVLTGRPDARDRVSPGSGNTLRPSTPPVFAVSPRSPGPVAILR
ncbi:hypothetical protein [Streptomyces mutabilis]|uniref:hypothetical protein n=1 Tax=Streptomyces mutabilis TaxID=67332 RepID=UPI0036A6F087